MEKATFVKLAPGLLYNCPMVSGVDFGRGGSALPMQFRVLGPDSGGPSPTEVRRLFKGQRMTAARRSRLGQSGRILAMAGTRAVGLAAFERSEREMRVTELGVDPDSAGGTDQIVAGLLDALELSCMASGTRRMVLLPRATMATAVLRRRGYVSIGEGSAGSWFEKTFV